MPPGNVNASTSIIVPPALELFPVNVSPSAKAPPTTFVTKILCLPLNTSMSASPRLEVSMFLMSST